MIGDRWGVTADEVGRAVSVSSGTQLTARVLGAVISYVVEPHGDRTRLLMKLISDRYRVSAPLIALGDLVMARRQLLTIKRLVESG